MQIVAVVNQKGGVGKTTTSVNLAAALAELGKPVLLIDADPQANATSGLGLEQTEMSSLYPVLIGEKTIHEVIRATDYPNLSVIPSELDLAGCEIELARMDAPLMRLREVLEPLRQDAAYPHILIDCPPSLGILMTNALAAADGLLVPIQCEFYALEGIQKILGLVERMRAPEFNPSLQILGVLMTMYDTRTRLSQQVVEDVQTHLADRVFQTIIPRSIRLSEAPGFGKPITSYDPSSAGAHAYRRLAAEFLGRTATAA